MNRLFLALILGVSVMACNSDQAAEEKTQPKAQAMEVRMEDQLAYIAGLEKKVWGLDATPTGPDAKKLLNAYSAFVNANRDHELAPEFMFNAGRLSSTTGKPRKAIELFTDLHDNFPGYKKRTEAAYLVAFIYDSQLNDREKARAAYEKVIELYPDSPWADDAQASINNLYKTDEELIKEFEEKNK